MRRSRVHDDVCSFAQNVRIGADLDAPWGIACSRNFTEVAARFCGIGVDRADHLDRLLFPHQAHQRCTDRPHAILDDTNLLPHVNSCDSRSAGMQPDEPNKVKESPASFNYLKPVARWLRAAG